MPNVRKLQDPDCCANCDNILCHVRSTAKDPRTVKRSKPKKPDKNKVRRKTMSKEEAILTLRSLLETMRNLQAEEINDPEDIMTGIAIGAEDYEKAIQKAVESLEKN